MSQHIQIIARAVIVDDGHVLLTRGNNGGGGYTYLPGGHVELSESTQGALMRELHEELGATEVQVTSFLGLHECRWHDRDGQLQHEINVIFRVEAPGFSRQHEPASQEAHISFTWAKLDELTAANLLPHAMQRHLLDLIASTKAGVLLVD